MYNTMHNICSFKEEKGKKEWKRVEEEKWAFGKGITANEDSKKGLGNIFTLG